MVQHPALCYSAILLSLPRSAGCPVFRFYSADDKGDDPERKRREIEAEGGERARRQVLPGAFLACGAGEPKNRLVLEKFFQTISLHIAAGWSFILHLGRPYTWKRKHR